MVLKDLIKLKYKHVSNFKFENKILIHVFDHKSCESIFSSVFSLFVYCYEKKRRFMIVRIA